MPATMPQTSHPKTKTIPFKKMFPSQYDGHGNGSGMAALIAAACSSPSSIEAGGTQIMDNRVGILDGVPPADCDPSPLRLLVQAACGSSPREQTQHRGVHFPPRNSTTYGPTAHQWPRDNTRHSTPSRTVSQGCQ